MVTLYRHGTLQVSPLFVYICYRPIKVGYQVINWLMLWDSPKKTCDPGGNSGRKFFCDSALRGVYTSVAVANSCRKRMSFSK